jgi:hypothetical protein
MKKLITLLEISTSEFRTKIKGLGHSEKRSELTSGGDLNAEFLDILSLLFAEWEKINPNCNLIFTSGNDAFHKGIKTYVSRHTKGEAVDVTLNQSCRSSFITLLNTYKSKYNGFSFIDEYTNPTSKATGGHFHISYRKGNPEGSGKSSTTDTSTTDTSTPTANSGYQSYMSDIANSFAKGLIPTNENRLIKNVDKIRKLLK